MRVDLPGISSWEAAPDIVLLVSDLHIGVGKNPETGKFEPRENFFADAAFTALLEAHDPATHKAPLLVLNGDIWDFLRVSERPQTDAEYTLWRSELAALGVTKTMDQLRTPAKREGRYGLRTDDYKSVWKLLRIARGHQGFFAGLGWWIAQGGSIVIVKGNHDVELYWPLVQRAVRRLVTGGGDPKPADERLQFAQLGFTVGNLYVEHGNQFEGVTALEGDPVLPGGTELNLPLGSLVNRYIINQLEGIEPFLDNQKPLNKLLWDMFRAHPLRMIGIAWISGPFVARALKRYRFRDTLAFAIYFGLLFVAPLFLAAAAFAVLNEAWFHIGWLSDFLAGIPRFWKIAIGIAGPILPYLGGLIKDGKDYLTSRLRKRTVDIGEDDFGKGMHGQLGGARFPAAYQRVYGVFGHTHQPDVQRLPPVGSASEVFYLNSGTWIPGWDPARPDLIGRVIYSVIRFRAQGDGDYRHEYLEWRPDRGALVPEMILARE